MRKYLKRYRRIMKRRSSDEVASLPPISTTKHTDFPTPSNPLYSLSLLSRLSKSLSSTPPITHPRVELCSTGSSLLSRKTRNARKKTGMSRRGRRVTLQLQPLPFKLHPPHTLLQPPLLLLSQSPPITNRIQHRSPYRSLLLHHIHSLL